MRNGPDFKSSHNHCKGERKNEKEVNFRSVHLFCFNEFALKFATGSCIMERRNEVYAKQIDSLLL